MDQHTLFTRWLDSDRHTAAERWWWFRYRLARGWNSLRRVDRNHTPINQLAPKRVETDDDLSNLDRRHRGLPLPAEDMNAHLVLFWVVFVLGVLVSLVSLYFIGWFVWTIVTLAVTTVFGGA